MIRSIRRLPIHANYGMILALFLGIPTDMCSSRQMWDGIWVWRGDEYLTTPHTAIA